MQTMNVIVAGCRDFNDYDFVEKELNTEFSRIPVGSIIEGGAKGVDHLAARYATYHKIMHRRFPANWHLYGKTAGPIRNMAMAEQGDVLIAFWDGKSRGTKDMIKKAKRKGLLTLVIPIPAKED